MARVVDRLAGFQIDLPSGWETMQASDEVATYGLVRPRKTTHVHLLVVRARATVAAAPGAILTERLRALESREGVRSQAEEWFECEIDREAHRSVRCLLESPHGRFVIEETCIRTGTDVVVLQVQYDDVRTSRTHLEQLARIREGFSLFTPDASTHAREEGRPLPGARLWNVLRRNVHASLSEVDRMLDVIYEVCLQNCAGRHLDRIGFALLHPSMAEIRSIAVDDREARLNYGAGVVQVLLDPPVEPGSNANLRIKYRLRFERVNAWMSATHRLHFDSGEVVCATPEWLPRLIVHSPTKEPDGDAQNSSELEAAHDAKGPFRLTVEVPSEYEVFGSGRLVNRFTNRDRTSYGFSNEDSSTPFINYVALRSPRQQSVDGITIASGGRQLTGATVGALRETIRQGVRLLSSWLGPVSMAEAISLVFYSGDQCLGLGPLLLIGRFFKDTGSSIDRPVADLFTLREMVLHELSHLWFGGVATATGGDTRRLHEVFANYLTLRMMGEICGPKAQADLIRRLTSHSFDNTRDAASAAVTIYGLRESANAVAFDGAVRQCFTDHEGRHFDRTDISRILMPMGLGADVL